MEDGAGMTGMRGERRLAALAVFLTLAACTEPRLSAGLTIGPNGIGVTPVLSGNVGGVGVGVTPGTIR
jgi:hypothetical protein